MRITKTTIVKYIVKVVLVPAMVICAMRSASAAVITFSLDSITSSTDINGGSAGLIQANNFSSSVFSGSPDVDIDGQTLSSWSIFSPDNFSAGRLTAT